MRNGALIISASGMCDAGRIKYHLLHNLPNVDSVIVFTGFQAAGTLGRRLVDGARTVRIFGEEVPVRARIATLGGLSAHADQAGLLTWLRGFTHPPSKTFVVHGEATAAHAFADCIRTELHWQVAVPGPARQRRLRGRRSAAAGLLRASAEPRLGVRTEGTRPLAPMVSPPLPPFTPSLLHFLHRA